MRVFFACLIAVLLMGKAEAQQIVLPCVPSGASCIPVSAANPLPVGGGTVTFTDITANNLNLPDTAAGPVGFINFGGARFVHDTGGITNTFVGHLVANSTVTGIQNTGVGSSALLGLAGANNNTAFGYFALGSVSANPNNSAFGSSAMSAVTGTANTGVGFNVGANLGAASQNTFVGSGTGLGITTGSSNTIIGQGVTGLTSGLSSAIILATGGGVIQADFANTSAATWTFNGALAASLTTAVGTNAVCNTPGTKTALTVQVWATGCAASSARFKEGIASIDREKALDDVLRFQPVSYFYKPEFNMGDDRHVGFTAEQIGSVDPQWITYETDGITPHAVKYQEMVPLLTAAIQQIKAEFEAYKRSHP